MNRRRVPGASGAGRGAYTLIEIMIVVGIMGIVMSMGIPAFYSALRKEGLRRAVDEVVGACNKARAQAIMSGTTAELRFRPLEKAFSTEGFSGQLPDNVNFEMLDVNFVEFKEWDAARVRFYPNGTCDEMTLVLRSDKNEYRLISLEITTGLASVENDPQKFR
jgi:prepilin-type N-terminal cleavage/methylation domain-containing protein